MSADARAERILSGVPWPLPAVVLIDGRSGSGKTVLAEELRSTLGGSVLHLDDLYPGWDGLAAGSEAVAEALASGAYRRFDWNTLAPAEHVELSPDGALIIEGCGALTRRNLEAAHEWAAGRRVHSIWLECPAAVRRARALNRDGETFRPHWDRWAAQEEAHLAREAPIALAVEVMHCR